jgi:multidrug transporter EmrE-like cation transporter
MNLFTFSLVVCSVCLNALAQVVLRKAMTSVGKLPPLSQPLEIAFTVAGSIWLWIGFCFFAGSISLWLIVLSRVPVGVAYPMASLGYIIGTVLGILVLGEAIIPVRIAGLALIVTGVFLISRTA